MTWGVILGDMRQWIDTTAIVGLLGLAAKHWQATRKLDLAERQDDREGWGALIKTLQADVASVRNELAHARQEHTNCESSMAELRSEMAQLHALLYSLSVRYNFPLDIPLPNGKHHG